MNTTKVNLTVLTVGVIIGIILSAGISKVHFKNYHEVHDANIGKFMFIDGKIYSLTEMLRDEGVKLPITK
jgi:uncharacterized membrane protein